MIAGIRETPTAVIDQFFAGMEGEVAKPVRLPQNLRQSGTAGWPSLAPRASVGALQNPHDFRGFLRAAGAAICEFFH